MSDEPERTMVVTMILNIDDAASDERVRDMVAEALEMAGLSDMVESIEVTDIDEEATLEELDGYVERIDGDKAYVTLESRKTGDVLHGEYPAAQLADKGIGEQGRFLVRTVARGEWTRVDIDAVPARKVTDEEAADIAERIRLAFPGDGTDILY
jgi:hypothetical protein